MVTERKILAESYCSTGFDRQNHGKHASYHEKFFTDNNTGVKKKEKKQRKDKEKTKGKNIKIIIRVGTHTKYKLTLVQRIRFLGNLSSVGQLKGLSSLILVIYEFIYLFIWNNQDRQN
jgi:hypothetical protein